MSNIVQKIDNLLRLVSQPMSRGTGKTDALIAELRKGEEK